MTWSTFFDERPWTKLLQVLAATIVAVMAVVISFTIVSERSRMKRLASDHGTLVADMVEDAMSESLAIGDNSSVADQFASLKTAAPDIDVFVFDPDTRVAFGTRSDLVGHRAETVTSSAVVAQAVGRAIANQPQKPYYEETVDGHPQLTVVRPILNSTRCHHCHGASRQVLGSIMVRTSTEATARAIGVARNINIVVGCVGLVVAILLLRWLLARVVRSLLADILSGSDIMASAATELSGVSQKLSSDSRSTSDRSLSVTSSADELSTTLSSVSASAEQTSTGTDAITIATEQMNASVGEIAREAAAAMEVTRDAVAKSSTATQMARELGDEALEIGSVTDVITGISAQINLLALNATIESARAGEAGRGFAVVASEIKKLAGQTAQATEVIRTKIEGIQGATTAIVDHVEGFAAVIQNLDATVATIASAVEEQAATTSEIASSIGQSSAGVRQITQDVTLIASGLDGIVNDMAQMNEVARMVSDGSVTVNQRAEGLSELATRMTGLIARFRM